MGYLFFFFWWDPNSPVDGCLAVSCSFGVLIEDQRRQWHPTPVLLPGKSHGPRSLVGCSPQGREESDTTEQLHFHFSLSCIGEGNGNPLQYSCLENPRDRGAWWAAICGVAQCRTWLKQLSSSSIGEDEHMSFYSTILELCYVMYGESCMDVRVRP